LLTSAGATAFDEFKVPHLRFIYRKDNPADGAGFRKLGFGLVHDGVLQDIVQFLHIPAFNAWAEFKKDDIAAFVLSLDTGTAPIVGYQRHVSQANAGDPAVAADVALFESQAAAGNGDVIVKGYVDGLPRGYRFDVPSAQYLPDDPALPGTTWA